MDSGKQLKVEELNTSLTGNDPLEVPVYDFVGNVGTKTLKNLPLNPKLFVKVIINQAWYYNDTKNIVFNKIPDIILYASFYNKTDLKPILRIVFNQ